MSPVAIVLPVSHCSWFLHASSFFSYPFLISFLCGCLAMYVRWFPLAGCRLSGCRVAIVGHKVLVERPLSQRAGLRFPVLRGRGPLARPRPQSESFAELVCGHAGSLSPPGSSPCPRLELLPRRWGGSVAADRREGPHGVVSRVTGQLFDVIPRSARLMFSFSSRASSVHIFCTKKIVHHSAFSGLLIAVLFR